MQVGDKFIVRIENPQGYSLDGVDDGDVGVVTKVEGGGEYWTTITRTDGSESVDFLIDIRDMSPVIRVGVVFQSDYAETYYMYVSANKPIAEVREMLHSRFSGIAYLAF